MFTRRQLLKNAAVLTASTWAFPPNDLLAANSKRKFRIGACDWSLGKNSDIAAFDIAKQIGLDGIMVNIGSLENNFHLRDKKLQDDYLAASQSTGIDISSIAIAELNKIPYKSDPRTEQWVLDSIDVAARLRTPVILLAFFDKNDLRNDERGKKEVIKRLKKAAPVAEKKNIILGIESYLSASEHLDIIEQVGSKNVKVYIDFRNTADAGYDVFKEVKQLGKDLICELHIKENGFLLGQGTLDWKKISELLYGMDYYGDGWMQIEWSMPDNANVVDSYKHNLGFLQNLFSKEI